MSSHTASSAAFPARPSPGSTSLEVRFHKGDNIMALDVRQLWCSATVIAERGEGVGREVKVHYTGWNKRWDEWLLDRSVRLRPIEKDSASGGSDPPANSHAAAVQSARAMAEQKAYEAKRAAAEAVAAAKTAKAARAAADKAAERAAKIANGLHDEDFGSSSMTDHLGDEVDAAPGMEPLASEAVVGGRSAAENGKRPADSQEPERQATDSTTTSEAFVGGSSMGESIPPADGKRAKLV